RVEGRLRVSQNGRRVGRVTETRVDVQPVEHALEALELLPREVRIAVRGGEVGEDAGEAQPLGARDPPRELSRLGRRAAQPAHAGVDLEVNREPGPRGRG